MVFFLHSTLVKVHQPVRHLYLQTTKINKETNHSIFNFHALVLSSDSNFPSPFLVLLHNAASLTHPACSHNVELFQSKHLTQNRSSQWPSFHTLNKILSFISTRVGLARISPGRRGWNGEGAGAERGRARTEDNPNLRKGRK